VAGSCGFPASKVVQSRDKVWFHADVVEPAVVVFEHPDGTGSQ